MAARKPTSGKLEKLSLAFSLQNTMFPMVAVGRFRIGIPKTQRVKLPQLASHVAASPLKG